MSKDIAEASVPQENTAPVAKAKSKPLKPIVVIDSIDSIAEMIGRDVAAENGKGSIDQIPYGGWKKLWTHAMETRLIAGLDVLHGLGISCVLTCHATTTEILNPSGENFMAIVPKLNAAPAGVLLEYCDINAYINHRKSVVTDGSKNKVNQHVKRELIVELNPVFSSAGNRLGLSNIELDTEKFLAQIEAVQSQPVAPKAGVFEIEGLLANNFKPQSPFRMMLIGEEKSGKSTFVSQLPNAIVIPTEEGQHFIKDAKAQYFPPVKNSNEFYAVITKLITHFSQATKTN